uniref:hypothetical protein n=1 Tax=Facilibium subflavum TaxID=2219058 RepID=UPI0013C35A4D
TKFDNNSLHLQNKHQQDLASNLAKKVVQYAEAVDNYANDHDGASLENSGVAWLVHAVPPAGSSPSTPYLPKDFSLQSPLLDTTTDYYIITTFANYKGAERKATITIKGFKDILSGAQVTQQASNLSAKESSQFSYQFLRQSNSLKISFLLNSPNSNWLSIYGKNQMQGNIVFDTNQDATKRQIDNINTLSFLDNKNKATGSIAAEDGTLEVGESSRKVMLGSATITNVSAYDLKLSTLGNQEVGSEIKNLQIEIDSLSTVLNKYDYVKTYSLEVSGSAHKNTYVINAHDCVYSPRNIDDDNIFDHDDPPYFIKTSKHFDADVDYDYDDNEFKIKITSDHYKRFFGDVAMFYLICNKHASITDR